MSCLLMSLWSYNLFGSIGIVGAIRQFPLNLPCPMARRSSCPKRPQEFTKNFPSTFLILPRQHQVYPIRLDKAWNTGPKLSEAAEAAVSVKAIYQVPSSAQSKHYKVWSGRAESGSYTFKLGSE